MEAYIPALSGGLLIGAAAAVLLVLLGRVAGVSGVLFSTMTGLLKGDVSDNLWRILFLVGLVLGPIIVHQFGGLLIPDAPEGSITLAIVAGLLAGFGIKVGSGCTSGHGICGMARLSKRSIIATCTFMAAGFVTVFIARHVMGA
ncbi:hypothetical protein A3715_14315 [Oleiphilus sp. HI0009]|uniref:YeeE/YedE family protein n=1 Tax=unclassified Oleiphilus TaxID=2631174 RepID=UPI0007C207D5|nr:MULTISPECIES: YeeE/YedE thiosulfate transporter family protein [unclassified Oleiphilus]KZX75563.1 hypothetical protein A3715_14315 [Oleiphilus sp. HI0009]KZY68848.1 hypothetical protein A3739_10215 [Oleiphilus sp. HI0067]KZY69432.1 hypothetical protein A3738_04335 [Oleiphilus sp. HI0066]